MDFFSDLINMLVFHGFIKANEKDQFHRYIGLRNDEFLPDTERRQLEYKVLIRISSLQIFLDVIKGVEKLLEDKLTKEVFDKIFENDSELVSGLLFRLPVRSGQEGVTPGKTPEFGFIRADQIIKVPTRTDNLGSIMANIFGTPIEISLRERGLLKGKLTASEFEYHIVQTILHRICPALDAGLDSGKFTKVECNYVSDFITVFRYLMSEYQGIKKGHVDMDSDKLLKASTTYRASNKRIENTIDHLIKAGLDPRDAEYAKAVFLNKSQAIKCINPQCNNTFIPRNKKHRRCQDCSKPKNYLKEWRATKADKENKPSYQDHLSPKK